MNKSTTEIENEVKKFKLENGIPEDSKQGIKVKTDSLEELEQDYGTLKIRGEINGSNIIKFRTNLTGQDLKICKSKYERIKKNKASVIPEFDETYYLIMAERMTDIPYEDFYNLHITDTNKVVKHVKDFLGE